jgi:hypothetical protein
MERCVVDYIGELLNFADEAYAGARSAARFIEYNIKTQGKGNNLVEGEPFFDVSFLTSMNKYMERLEKCHKRISKNKKLFMN